MRYDAERDMVQWGVGDEWHDLYTMAEVLAPLYEKLDEMTARAETAAGEAAGHAQAAQTAREQVENVLHDAEGHAREALYQANNAKAAAQVAKQAGAASEASAGLAEQAAQRSDADAQAALRAAEEAGIAADNAVALAGAAADSAFQAEGSAQAANQAYVEAERMTTRAETARAAAETAAEEARAAAEEAKNAAGTGGGGGYVASDEPPENTKAMWVNTAEPEEAVALGVTGVETAEGVDLYCTDELGTTTVTVRHGKDGPQGPQGAPGADYELTDDDVQKIAGIAAGMVQLPGGGDEWEYIGEFGIADSEIAEWHITEDAEGNPIRLKQMYLDCELQGTGAGNIAMIIANPAEGEAAFSTLYAYANIGGILRSTKTLLKINVFLLPSGKGSSILAVNSTSAYNAAWYRGYTDKGYLGGFAFKSGDSSKSLLGVGCKVKVWGVRA